MTKKPSHGRLPRTGAKSRTGLALELAMLGVGDLYDYSGNKNIPINNGAVWSPGNDGPALSFDGSSSYFLVPDNDLLDGMGKLTVIADIWAEAGAQADSFAALVLKKNSYQITQNGGSNAISYFINTDSSSLNLTGGSSSFFDGQWHQVALTYDGATSTAYEDGVAVDSGALSGTVGINGNNVFCGSENGSSNFFAGKIKRVMIFRTALLPQQIRDLYDNPYQAWKTDNIALFAAAQGGVPPVTGAVNLLDGLFERKRLIA
jgi:hypothetical protein